MVFRLIVNIVLILGLSGCATTILMEGNGLVSRVNEPILKDTVVAIGKLDNNSSKRLGYESVIVLAGERKSYLFVEGGEKIVEIAQAFSTSSVLDSNKFVLPKNYNLLFDQDVIWGNVVFNYTLSENNQRNEVEKQEIIKLGFKENYRNHFSITIPVKASAKPALQLNALSLPKLDIGRELLFYTPNGNYVEKPNLGAIVSLPFTLTFDVITSPIQLVGGGILIFVIISNLH